MRRGCQGFGLIVSVFSSAFTAHDPPEGLYERAVRTEPRELAERIEDRDGDGHHSAVARSLEWSDDLRQSRRGGVPVADDGPAGLGRHGRSGRDDIHQRGRNHQHNVQDGSRCPLNTFELTLPQGRFSALAASGNLCKSKRAEDGLQVEGRREAGGLMLGGIAGLLGTNTAGGSNLTREHLSETGRASARRGYHRSHTLSGTVIVRATTTPQPRRGLARSRSQ